MWQEVPFGKNKRAKLKENTMYNIAIDGPAGAGKSTIAKLVAKKLGFIYVDTGSMYRTLALACIRAGVSAEEKDKVVDVCNSVQVSLEYVDGNQVVRLNGEDVSGYIRNEEVGNMTSAIAVYEPVREILVKMQQKIATEQDLVMDGRDIGSVVLPNANLKIYLTASVETRARRRYKELVERALSVILMKLRKILKTEITEICTGRCLRLLRQRTLFL